jgi:hypothetical protein
MPTTYLTGNDGSIVFPNAHQAQFATWNATFSRNVSDVTGYSDSGRRRRLGIWDVSGSAGGTMITDGANSSPGVGSQTEGGSSITLRASTACYYTLTAVISEIAATSTKTGDAALSFNFAISDGTIPTETWDES